MLQWHWVKISLLCFNHLCLWHFSTQLINTNTKSWQNSSWVGQSTRTIPKTAAGEGWTFPKVGFLISWEIRNWVFPFAGGKQCFFSIGELAFYISGWNRCVNHVWTRFGQRKKPCLKPLLLWAVTSSLSPIVSNCSIRWKGGKVCVLILPVIFSLFI